MEISLHLASRRFHRSSLLSRTLLLPLLSLGAACAPCTLRAESPYATPQSRITRYENGKIKSTLRVDPLKQIVEETLFLPTGKLAWKLVRELDEDCQPMVGVKTDAQGQVLSRHKYLCLRGRLEEEEIFSAQNVFQERLVYIYEPSGALKRIEHLNPAGELVSSERITPQGASPIIRTLPTDPPPATPASKNPSPTKRFR